MKRSNSHMIEFNHKPSSAFLLGIGFILLAPFLQNVSSTEVTESYWLYDDSMGVEIGLPVLECHSKHIGYKEVLWYKDYTLVKKGSSDPSNHILPVVDLLGNLSSVQFEYPFKLQGYYWCETDINNDTAIHSYLFRIQEIHTYVGRFLSTQDSLGEDESMSLKDRISLKKVIYEDEMQDILFGFLPKPNTYVTDINVHASGLEVRFYLYARRLLHPRQPYANELVEDQHELDWVFEYLNNETTAADADLYQQIIDWTNFRGINIKDITLRSTLGCFQDVSLLPAEPPREVTWPYAIIGDVVIPDESCSSKSGLAVTRVCTGSFYNGARWGVPSGKCNMRPNRLTSELRNLYNKFGDDPKPIYIKQLQGLTKNSRELTVTDLHIVTDIMTELSEKTNLNSNEMDNIFSVIDHLVETNRSELQAAKSTIKLTSRLLRVIGNILKKASLEGEEVHISKMHLLVDTKNTKVSGGVDDHVIGIAILSSGEGNALQNRSVEFILNGGSIPKENCLAYYWLPPDLVKTREAETQSKFQTQINIVFFKDWLLFPNPKDVLYKRNYKVLPSSVMHVSISGGPVWNLTNPVHLYFKNVYGKEIEKPVCVQFDPHIDNGKGSWSTEGCEYAGLKDGFYNCLCHHLSIFAVVLSETPDTSSKRFRLGTAIYVGCAVSIIALSITVLMYLLSKVWRKTVDHSILFWIALSLLCFLILLFISEMNFVWKPSCLLLAMLLHYMILVILGFLLVQAIMHRLRFANKTDMEEVPNFILKSALSCWGVPIIIMIIIWLTKDYKYYNLEHKYYENCWKTVSDVSKVTLIPIVTILVITLCINLCAVYAVTCRFKKDFLVGNSIYDESVLKFRIAVAIYFFFVMSWLFGFFALNERSRELRILFSISVTLTSYYVTLFFIFQEVSLWEMCRKWKKNRKGKSSGEVVKFVAEKEKYTDDRPVANN